MVSARRAEILKAIIEEYVATGQPVGSGTLVQRVQLGVSSATVRNDMAWLEAEGFITQPHTSAGRMPSDTGYRFYVDNFANTDGLGGRDRRVITGFFTDVEIEIDHLLQATSRLLTQITQQAAVVVAPQLDDSTLMSLHLTTLDPTRLLVIGVTQAGRVAKLVVDVDVELEAGRVGVANEVLSAMLVGRVDWLAPHPAPAHGDPEVATILARVLGALAGAAADDSADVYFGGAASLAAHFDEIATVRDILQTLEQHHALVGMLRVAVEDDQSAVIVKIGSELRARELHAASLVFAPYRSGGAVGLLGLVGPTRMDYSRAMSAVHSVSAHLERTLHA